MQPPSSPNPVSPRTTSPKLPPAFLEMDLFKKRLLRTKTIVSQTSVEEGPESSLQKVLSTYDLISLGVGSCCGTGMYVVAGLVAHNVAGPAALFSFIIAAIASILSGVCYGEFGVRVPKTSGSAYMYSYVTVGEFVAFLIGWNLILEYIIGSAAGASAISACFDALGNHSMKAYLEEHVGTVIGNTYPDFLGFFIGITMTVVLAVGVQKSVRFNNILNAVNFIVWAFIIVAGLFFVRGANWSNFAPWGASGVFSGAATCFYAFIGFDIIATTGEEARNPSRSIPIAIFASLVICLVAYISVSIILTLMVPYDEIHGASALMDMFVQNGFTGAKYVVALGSISALLVSLLGSMFPMPRVIYAMARDGLLFGFLAHVNERTGTPLLATIITGSIASFMSLFTSLKILVEMMSIGTLLAYTLVSMSVLILRYQPDKYDLEPAIPMAHKLDTIMESPDDPDNEDVFTDPYGASQATGKVKDDQKLIGDSMSSHKNQTSYGSFDRLLASSDFLASKMAMIRRHAHIWWLRLGFPADESLPNETSAKTAILFTGLLLVSEIGSCMIIVLADHHLQNAAWWAIILLVGFLGSVVTCLVIILRQPQNNRKLAFMAPCVPILPSCAMFINVYLMLKLPLLTWERLGVWILIGLVLYFSYSMWHSVKESRQKKYEDTSEEPKKDVSDTSCPEGQTELPETEQSVPVNDSIACPSPGGPPSTKPRRPPLPSQESIERMHYKRQASLGSSSNGDAASDNGNQPAQASFTSINPFNNDSSTSTEGTTRPTRLSDRPVSSREDSAALNPYARPRPRPKAKLSQQQNTDSFPTELPPPRTENKYNPFNDANDW